MTSRLTKKEILEAVETYITDNTAYNPSADELKLKIFDGVDENAVELTGNYDIKVSFDWN